MELYVGMSMLISIGVSLLIGLYFRNRKLRAAAGAVEMDVLHHLESVHSSADVSGIVTFGEDKGAHQFGYYQISNDDANDPVCEATPLQDVDPKDLA